MVRVLAVLSFWGVVSQWLGTPGSVKYCRICLQICGVGSERGASSLRAVVGTVSFLGTMFLNGSCDFS